jgi:hypothetical protein
MSGLNRSDLQTLRAQTIYKNGQQKIKGQDHTNFLIDLIDSCANLITDKEKLNIYEYNNSLAYSSGIGVLYSGGLYQANKDTGLGAFNVADWDLISSGGGSSIFKGEWVTLTTYAIGDFVVEAGDMYVCTTGNTDASFTPANWLKVIEGNITQVTSTLAFDDGSTNTDWDGSVFPAFQGPVNNQLASRIKTIEGSISSNPSDNIAYVAESGSDAIGEYELGNPLKPFLTIQAAIDAVPSANSIVRVLGGTYTANIVISTVSANAKTNFVLDLRGVTFNTVSAGTGFVISNSTNCTVLLEGGFVNGFINIGSSSNVSIIGGKIENLATISPCLNVGPGAIIDNVAMKNAGTQTISCANTVLETRPLVVNCRISTTSVVNGHSAIFRARTCLFDNCYIEGPSAISTEGGGNYPKLINCLLVSTVSNTIKSENSIVNGIFTKCTFKSLANATDNVSMTGASVNLRFYDCDFIAQRHCVDVSAGIDRLGDNTIFQNCNFFCNQDGISSGKILNDAANTGTGSTEFITSVYNATWSTNAANATDNNSTTIIGLLPPPL